MIQYHYIFSTALTLGAGVQWHEAYDAAKSHERSLVGGVSRGGSVGAAGGWILGNVFLQALLIFNEA